MAITTQSGANAGVQPPFLFRKQSGGNVEGIGFPTSLFYTTGEPAAAAVPTPGLAGAALTSYAGQLPFQNPVSGNTYLYRFDSRSSALLQLAGGTWLVDRLWHNSGIDVTLTTAQTINSVAWPARDQNASTNGVGVQIALEVSTATTNGGTVNIDMSYTNSAGVSGRTGNIAAFPITAVPGTFAQFTLDAGDVGVRSVQSITIGTSLITGVVHLVAYRVLDMQHRLAIGSGTEQLITQGNYNLVNGVPVRVRDMHAAGFVRLWDNTVPFIVTQSCNTSSHNGEIGIFQVAQG